MIRISTALACCVLASGCVSTGVYPDYWADKAKAKSGGCPDIDGEYLNEGESFYEASDEQLARETVDLASALSDGIDYSIPSAELLDKIRLERVDKTLRVTATLIDGSAMNFERPVLRCRNSMLLMEADWTHSLVEEGGAELMGVSLGMIHWFERTSWMLGRAEDGSLLMRTTSAGSLMFYWMPVLPGGESTWIRFPAVAPTREKLASVGP